MIDDNSKQILYCTLTSSRFSVYIPFFSVYISCKIFSRSRNSAQVTVVKIQQMEVYCLYKIKFSSAHNLNVLSKPVDAINRPSKGRKTTIQNRPSS